MPPTTLRTPPPARTTGTGQSGKTARERWQVAGEPPKRDCRCRDRRGSACRVSHVGPSPSEGGPGTQANAAIPLGNGKRRDLDFGKASRPHPQEARDLRRDADDTPARRRQPVAHAHHGHASGAEVPYPGGRAERQCVARRGIRIQFDAPAICHPATGRGRRKDRGLSASGLAGGIRSNTGLRSRRGRREQGRENQESRGPCHQCLGVERIQRMAAARGCPGAARGASPHKPGRGRDETFAGAASHRSAAAAPVRPAPGGSAPEPAVRAASGP